MAEDPHAAHLEPTSEKPTYPFGGIILVMALLGIIAFLWLVLRTDRPTPLPDAWNVDAFSSQIEDAP
jgi:hypothetical protein